MTHRWAIDIPGWTPCLDNRLVGAHPMTVHKLKRRDVEAIGIAALCCGVPRATTRRRVAVTLRDRYGSFPDDTAPWKSLLDALVRNRLLVDDSRRWCELAFPPTFERGPKGCVIELEDIP